MMIWNSLEETSIEAILEIRLDSTPATNSTRVFLVEAMEASSSDLTVSTASVSIGEGVERLTPPEIASSINFTRSANCTTKR